MTTVLGALVAGLTIAILELSGADVSFTLAILIGLLMGCVVALIEAGS